MGRNPYWSTADADLVLLNVALATDSGDFHFLSWEPGYDADYNVWAGDQITLGAYNSLDFAMIYLQEGALYDFSVISDDWHPEIAIYDIDGWLLNYDDPDDLLFERPDAYGEDSIIGFVPEYSGYYYIDIGWEYQNDPHGHVSLSIAGYGHAFEAQILDDDAYHWNATIISPEGEFVSPDDAQLYRAYMGALGRLPDWDGFHWWSDQIAAGNHDLWTMAEGFIRSEEFQYLADHNFDGWVDDAEFVSHMYESVFGREPDWDGFHYWHNELRSGRRDQVDVFVDMTQSNEYVELTLVSVAELQVYG